MKWVKRKLVEICNPKQWKNLPISELTEEGYPVYGANGIIGKYKEFNHEFPTIAITCRGATCGSLHITHPKSYITSNAMALDDLAKDVNQKFLYYTLNKRSFKDVISGSAQPQITREGLSKIVLNIPEDLEDQIRIANILSKAEALISQRKESLRLLDELLKSTFLDMFGDPVRNEKGWEKKTMNDIATQITDGEHATPIRTESGVKLLSARNIKDGYLDFKAGLDYIGNTEYERIAKRCKPERNNILMSCSGSVGRVSIVNTDEPFSLVRSVALIKLNKSSVVPLYIQSWMQTKHFQNEIWKGAKTSSQSNIFTGAIKKLPVLIPPLKLQTQFAHIVEKTEALKAHYQTSLQELENLYGSLSQRAFSSAEALAQAGKGELGFKEGGSSFAKATEDKLAMAAEPRVKYSN